jgi:DNA processing protein
MDSLEKGRLSILHGTPGLGNKILAGLLAKFASCEEIFHASPIALQGLLPPTVAVALQERRRRLDAVQIAAEMDKLGVDIVLLGEERYPPQLRHIHNPPPILYMRGRVELAPTPGLAVVGSRRATQYGRKTAREFAKQLASRGLTIISGLARGIDSQAHQGALEAEGNTISVLGSGINIIYPRENAALYREISERGLVMSEFPWNTPPLANHFPMRNRIISGLSLGVLVVEAQQKSGALLTVEFALEQGREVFAIPGPITSPYSMGTNQMIKEGAKLAAGAEDILEELPGYQPDASAADQLRQPSLPWHDEAEQLLLRHMDYERRHRDELLRVSGLTCGDLSLALLKLELEGIVQSLPGNYYVKIG